MNQLKKIIKSSLTYFLGNVSSNLVSFFLLPIYTTYLTTAEYGSYDVTRTYITFFSSIIFMQIPTVILRYMYDYDDKSKPITNATLILLVSTVLSFTTVFLVCVLFNIKYSFLIALFSLTESYSGYYGYVARGLGHNKLFAFSGFLSTVMNATTNILLIVCFGFDYSSLFISYIIGTVVQCILIEVKLSPSKYFKKDKIEKSIIKDMLKFALPFSLNICAYWFLNSYSRIIISSELGVNQNGIYAVATKFTVALNLVSSCIILAWQELSFKAGSEMNDRKEISRYYTNANMFYMIIMTLCTVLIIPAVKIVFPFMVNGDFLSGEVILPIAILATLLNIYSSFLTSIFSSIKKNNALFLSTIVGAIINILLAHILVGEYQLIGVTLANLIGFLVNVVIRLGLLYKLINMKIDLKILIFSLIGILLSLVVFYQLNIIINAIWVMALIILYIFVFVFKLMKGGAL